MKERGGNELSWVAGAATMLSGRISALLLNNASCSFFEPDLTDWPLELVVTCLNKTGNRRKWLEGPLCDYLSTSSQSAYVDSNCKRTHFREWCCWLCSWLFVNQITAVAIYWPSASIALLVTQVQHFPSRNKQEELPPQLNNPSLATVVKWRNQKSGKSVLSANFWVHVAPTPCEISYLCIRAVAVPALELFAAASPHSICRSYRCSGIIINWLGRRNGWGEGGGARGRLLLEGVHMFPHTHFSSVCSNKPRHCTPFLIQRSSSA